MVCSVGIGIIVAMWVVLLAAAVGVILYTARADSDGTFHWKWEKPAAGRDGRDAAAGERSLGGRSVSSAGGSGSGTGSRGHRRPRVVSTAVAIPPAERPGRGGPLPGVPSVTPRTGHHGVATVSGPAKRSDQAGPAASVKPVQSAKSANATQTHDEPDTMMLPVVSKISSKVVEIQAVGPWSVNGPRVVGSAADVASIEAEAERRGFPSEETNLG